MKLQMEVM